LPTSCPSWRPIRRSTLARPLAGVTAENVKAKRAAILKAVGKVTEGKLTADAKLDGLEAILVALDEVEVQEAMDEDDDEEDEDDKKREAEDSGRRWRRG
jgi:hypothetical protein